MRGLVLFVLVILVALVAIAVISVIQKRQERKQPWRVSLEENGDRMEVWITRPGTRSNPMFFGSARRFSDSYQDILNEIESAAEEKAYQLNSIEKTRRLYSVR